MSIEQLMEEFIEKHDFRMRKIYAKAAGNHADGEDVVQQAYLQALDAQRVAPRNQEEFNKWMFRIMQNCFIDQKRLERRSHVAYVEEVPDGVAVDHIGEYLTHQEIVTYILKEREDRHPFLQAVCIEGFTVTEYSAMSGINQQNLYAALRRFQQRVRKQMEEHLP